MNNRNCFVDRKACEIERDLLWDDDDGDENSVPYRNAPPISSSSDQAWLSLQESGEEKFIDDRYLYSEREEDVFNFQG